MKLRISTELNTRLTAAAEVLKITKSDYCRRVLSGRLALLPDGAELADGDRLTCSGSTVLSLAGLEADPQRLRRLIAIGTAVTLSTRPGALQIAPDEERYRKTADAAMEAT